MNQVHAETLEPGNLDVLKYVGFVMRNTYKSQLGIVRVRADLLS